MYIKVHNKIVQERRLRWKTQVASPKRGISPSPLPPGRRPVTEVWRCWISWQGLGNCYTIRTYTTWIKAFLWIRMGLSFTWFSWCDYSSHKTSCHPNSVFKFATPKIPVGITKKWDPENCGSQYFPSFPFFPKHIFLLFFQNSMLPHFCSSFYLMYSEFSPSLRSLWKQKNEECGRKDIIQ